MNGQITLWDLFSDLEAKETGKSGSNQPIPRGKAPVKIEDFGNEIGGARKDLWRGRGLRAEDVGNFNEMERKTYIRKENIWPKPDYNKMVEDGLAKEVVFFIKKIRDSLPVSPKGSEWDTADDEREKQERYFSFVSEIRDCVKDVKTKEDIAHLFHYLETKEYIVLTAARRYSILPKGEGLIGNPLVNAFRISYQQLAMQVRKKQFCYSEKEKILSHFEIIEVRPKCVEVSPSGISNGVRVHVPYGTRFFYPQDPEFLKEEKYPEGSFFVTKGRDILAAEFATSEEAEAFCLKGENLVGAKTRYEKKRKATLTPPILTDVVRIGEPYRKDGASVSGQDYLDTFHFYGGEFGNWLSQDDRQNSLDAGYDALCDFAYVLGIRRTAVTCDGKLSIAFGARGRGKALAHYEPLRKVINITKMRGAGSLGHELIHAMDFILGEALGLSGMDGSAMTRCLFSAPESMKSLMYAIKYRPGTYRKTRFYADAEWIDNHYAKSDKGYWASETEMLARAGACFLKDRLKEKGIRNDYLCGHADIICVPDEAGCLHYAAPQGEERERINIAFDCFFTDLKARGLLATAK